MAVVKPTRFSKQENESNSSTTEKGSTSPESKTTTATLKGSTSPRNNDNNNDTPSVQGSPSPGTEKGSPYIKTDEIATSEKGSTSPSNLEKVSQLQNTGSATEDDNIMETTSQGDSSYREKVQTMTMEEVRIITNFNALQNFIQKIFSFFLFFD
jgi:hypothetical protein